jgi:hypothetical protein
MTAFKHARRVLLRRGRGRRRLEITCGVRMASVRLGSLRTVIRAFAFLAPDARTHANPEF